MKLIKVRNRLRQNEVSSIIDSIRQGDLFIYPTDTVYGMGCDIKSQNVAEIFNIKQRSRRSPLSVAFGSMDMLKAYVNLDQRQEDFIRHKLSLPFTFIVKKKRVVPEIVTSGKETVGIRIPNNELIKEIILGVGVPIITTSANTSGHAPPTRVNDVESRILEAVELVIDAGPCKIGRPSKVIDLVESTVIRE